MPTDWFGICFCDATPVEVCLRMWYCAHAVRFELTQGLFSVSQVAAYAVQEKYPAAMVNKTCQDARFVKSMDQCNWMMPQMIKKGLRVFIVLKQDQRSGKLTEGVVQDILTKSTTHPHGIKVRLESGEVGRVKEIKR